MRSIPQADRFPPCRLRPVGWPREAIGLGARRLWERSGYPRGRDDEFWLEAERRILGGDAAVPDARDGARHLLIVDDQTHVGWTWAAALRRAAFRISIADNADAGWATLDEREFALLITSQDSIGRRSLELLAKVRGRSRTMPCILVRDQTGDVHDRVAQLLRPGATVERSVSIKRLLALVRGLLAASEDPRYVPMSARWGITP